MSNKLETVHCNLCGSSDTHKVSEKGQHGLPISLVLCKKCGLGYLNPRWDAEGYLNFYKNEYDKYYRPNISKKSDPPKGKNNPILKRLESYNLIDKGFKNVLDIGSGAGDNLMDIKTAFPTVNLSAIEPSQDSQRILNERGVSVLSDDVNANWDESATEKYDLVIMRHVLEHFLDPLAILKRVKNVMADNGVLYIAVPNNLNPTQNLEKIWFRVVHTYYFNKFSLENILHLAGLKEVAIVEGDQYNKGEVFLMAKKSTEALEPNFSKEHFEIQRKLFEDTLKEQNSLTYSIKEKAQKVKRRFFS